MLKNFWRFKNFISTSESEMLLRLVDKKFRRMPYESKHFDNVITGYRETVCSDWIQRKEFPSDIIERMKTTVNATLGRSYVFQPPHVLDLREFDSGIGPHIDNLGASGDVIAGLCLLSPCVFVFRREGVEIARQLVEPNTLYIQAHDLRYHCTHEIPMSNDKDHSIEGRFIQRKRRVSIMIRDVPKN
jgi:alkylated DNA repair protein alkB family protein 7